MRASRAQHIERAADLLDRRFRSYLHLLLRRVLLLRLGLGLLLALHGQGPPVLFAVAALGREFASVFRSSTILDALDADLVGGLASECACAPLGEQVEVVAGGPLLTLLRGANVDAVSRPAPLWVHTNVPRQGLLLDRLDIPPILRPDRQGQELAVLCPADGRINGGRHLPRAEGHDASSAHALGTAVKAAVHFRSAVSQPLDAPHFAVHNLSVWFSKKGKAAATAQ